MDNLFSILINNSANAQLLSEFIRNNQLRIEEFANANITDKRKVCSEFSQFVLLNVKTLNSLDYSERYNRAFISVLFDFAERMGESSVIIQLLQIIQKYRLDIGSRLEAARLYLNNIPNNNIYIERFDEICTYLQTAINEEDDDDKKSIAVFLNYYSFVVYNTSSYYSHEVRNKALQSDNVFPFLQKDIIKWALSLDITQQEFVYESIQKQIDEFLCKHIIFDVQINNEFIIENNTDYSRILSNTPKNFDNIRQISVSRISQVQNKDDIFYSLTRGVAVIDCENQLFAYMNSYGLMHKEKLLSAFYHFPFQELLYTNTEIIDWSCGQGIASMILFQFLSEMNIQLTIDSVTLVEPSEIALRRASLHVKHFKSQINVKTVLKDIDSLSFDDIKTSDNTIKLHLFSNILDVEKYSMVHLVDVINGSCNTLNYFVCVSPFINDIKTARFESFADFFNKNVPYHVIYEDKSRRGEWINNWTKITKIFKCVI